MNRNLGAAKEGVGHWWAQRVTAVALVPLSLWFVVSVIGLAQAELDAVRTWIAQPVNAVTLSILVGVTFYHLKLGLQVVIEDYVHAEPAKLIGLLLNTFGTVVLGAASLFAILKIAFAGP